ncbi:MAG: 2-hydroxyacyl-CoA dehydratase family protein [Dehalococcoidia bacterium]|nr:2-hydroxyacyl-CoA dehydratase family protein [Dehalococcoidia bacterium]
MLSAEKVQTFSGVMERFREINRTFPKSPEILSAKSRGQKVMGWVCTYVPEELLDAAGVLPVRISGYAKETDLQDGTAYFYVNNCSFARSCLQLGLRGEYDYLDGFVAGSTCDAARRLFDLWRHYVPLPFSRIITVPRKYSEKALDLYFAQVIQLKKDIERHLGIEITSQALMRSIALHNESRALLRALNDLRKLDEPPIDGAQTTEVLNASSRMPKEAFNDCLKVLLRELEGSKLRHKGKARIMVAGSALNNAEFIQSIERIGGLVVTDELCTGTRYWYDPVSFTDSTDPLKAIARRYLNNFPCARMYPSEERFRSVLRLVREFRVDGVISQTIRYCSPYSNDLPLLSDVLNRNGLPMLSLDVEYGTSGSGQILTRVQAFLEMLEARRK